MSYTAHKSHPISAALPSLPDDVRGTITNLDHIKKQILAYRKKVRGYTSVAITSAATTPIPTTLCATVRRFLLSDVYTSRDKRIIIYMSDSFLVELNTPGKITTVFIDGTFKVSPKHFAQLWSLQSWGKKWLEAQFWDT